LPTFSFCSIFGSRVSRRSAAAFSAGLGTPTYAASVADIFHRKHFVSIIGFADLGWGVGTAVGSWLGGYVFDVTRSYTPAFAITMGMTVLASLALWVASPCKIRRAVRKPVFGSGGQ